MGIREKERERCGQIADQVARDAEKRMENNETIIGRQIAAEKALTARAIATLIRAEK